MQIYIKEITVRTNGGSKEYDGTPLTASGYNIEGDLLPGHTVKSFICTGKQTNVGKSSNNFTITISDENGVDVTSHYKINRICAALTITPKITTITANSCSKPYDGTAISSSEYSVDGDLSKFTLEVTIVGSQTNIGYSDNVIQNVIIKDSQGNDITLNFSIICVNGRLTVTPPTN